MAHLSDSHTLLLNKFNIVAHHLICVTRTFQRQTDPLNAADLGATWKAMQVCSMLTHAARLAVTAACSLYQKLIFSCLPGLPKWSCGLLQLRPRVRSEPAAQAHTDSAPAPSTGDKQHTAFPGHH